MRFIFLKLFQVVIIFLYESRIAYSKGLCSINYRVRYGSAVDCFLYKNKEYVNLECYPGYEFETGVYSKQMLIKEVNLYSVACTRKK